MGSARRCCNCPPVVAAVAASEEFVPRAREHDLVVFRVDSDRLHIGRSSDRPPGGTVVDSFEDRAAVPRDVARIRSAHGVDRARLTRVDRQRLDVSRGESGVCRPPAKPAVETLEDADSSSAGIDVRARSQCEHRSLSDPAVGEAPPPAAVRAFEDVRRRRRIEHLRASVGEDEGGDQRRDETTVDGAPRAAAVDALDDAVLAGAVNGGRSTRIGDEASVRERRPLPERLPRIAAISTLERPR